MRLLSLTFRDGERGVVFHQFHFVTFVHGSNVASFPLTWHDIRSDPNNELNKCAKGVDSFSAKSRKIRGGSWSDPDVLL